MKFTKDDLREIYDAYFDALRRYLYYKTNDIDLSEDLVQEVFIKVWEKRESIKKETVKSLLYTIANNLMINHFNHQQVVVAHQKDNLTVDREHHTPQFELEHQEFKQLLNQAIQEMPEGSREVFLMNRIDKLKYDEIATRLGLSVKAVEKRMSKALSVIKERIGRKV